MISAPPFLLTLVPAVIAYWLVPVRFRLWVLTVASVVFLAAVDWFAGVTIGGAVLFWVIAERAPASVRRPLLGFVLLVAAVVLIGAKDLVPWAASVAGLGRIAAPVGWSYLAFRVISVAMNLRKNPGVRLGFAEWMSYLLFFPTVSAGPIERLDRFLKSTDATAPLPELIQGGWRVAVGLVKKGVVGELLLLPALPTLAAVLDGGSVLQAWVFVAGMFLFSYVDLSSYSDIAIGTSRLFGIRIVENFDNPLLASDLPTFWRRWHMSLMQWCQAHVYLPLLGRTRNPYIASYATFLLMGMWHDVGWNYLLWGLYHATLLSLFARGTRLFKERGWGIGGWPGRVLGTVTLWFLLCFSSVLSSTHDLGPGAALMLVGRMFGVVR